MDLRQLRYFAGIVQAGSLSRAADQLHVAPSAISYHLGALESELGRELVTRGPKGVQLTEAGSVLYRHAEAILRRIELAKQHAMSAHNEPSGRVSIGLPVALAPLLSYELFVRVRKKYPHILLHLSDSNSGLLRERLVNGRIDIALLFTDRAERGLVVEPLVAEELFYVTAEPDTSVITLADAVKRPLLCPGPNGSSRRVAQQMFNERNLSANWIVEIDTVSVLRRAIASGAGNSIMAWSALYRGEQTEALYCRRFADARLVRTVSLCFSAVVERTPAIEATALMLKSLVRELVESGTWQGVSLIETSAAPKHGPVPQKAWPTPLRRAAKRPHPLAARRRRLSA
jgi:LysR family transcriptional regulator, nitrogen assimilation regulatory protein